MDNQILVGTPKEVVGFAMLFNIGQLSLCIVDDADEICTTDIIKKHVMAQLRCRKVLLSATTLHSILATNFSYIPINVSVSFNAQQFFIRVGSVVDKLQAIVNVYKVLSPNAKAIVFCNVSASSSLIFNLYFSHFNYACFICDPQTRHSHQSAYDFLRLKRLEIVGANGGSSVEERRKMFDEFSNGKMPMAICSDIWARGIDVPSVKFVINYEIPIHSVGKKLDTKTYVCRMGRASRFGKLLAFECKKVFSRCKVFVMSMTFHEQVIKVSSLHWFMNPKKIYSMNYAISRALTS